MEYKSLYEEFNIETKKMYHKWFNKYIKDEDKESFKNAVIAMGNTYGVLRTLPRINREAFFKDIWDNREEIKSGEYDWTKKIEGIEGRHFWSYLSKVCYLISPEKYKIIYDNNNRIRLKELYPETNWNPENWQGNIDGIFDDLVNKYQVELKNCNSLEYYFYLDFLLWESN
ncbi:MAG: hypothetical protein UH788_06755 [Treponemataceae bacterium]|nr:hypothetical protein [Treponemataceae bacterium]